MTNAIDLNNITIGSDPEYAVVNQNGTPVSAVGFIPGTKHAPSPLDEQGEFSIQIDNVGVEGCIPPAHTKEEFINSMAMIKELTERKLQESQPTWALKSLSSQRYSADELNSETAQTFGCDPSWCIHTQNVSPRPSPEQVGNLRSFGFHIHIGFKLANPDVLAIDVATRIIGAMDIMCGLPSIVMDTDGDRRAIYGNAGDFRFRQIEDINIVEYRTLGGAMHDNDELTGFIYDQTIKAVELANSWSEQPDLRQVANAIDNGDVELAKELLNFYNIQIPAHAIRESIVTV